MRAQLRYLTAFAGFIVLILSLIVGLNVLVDPLWYFSGTRIGDHNYWFNLRISKINLIKRDPTTYDCLIMGSSVTAQLNASKIRDHRCFNAAFPSARAEELVIYARYFRDMGVTPRLVIVGLEPTDLGSARPSNLAMPSFIREGEPPPHVLIAYLSNDAFWFSVRSALGLVRHPISCTRDFTCHLRPLNRPLTPAEMLAGTNEAAFVEDFGQDSLSAHSELLEIWPQAHRIGYVPFVNAWAVARWQKYGLLESYLETIHAASSLFDEFYDFTAPSHITTDLAQTNDGEHYSTFANDMVAAAINGDQSPLGLAVHGRSYQAFKTLYLEKTSQIPSEIRDIVNSHTR